MSGSAFFAEIEYVTTREDPIREGPKRRVAELKCDALLVLFRRARASGRDRQTLRRLFDLDETRILERGAGISARLRAYEVA